MKQRRLEFGWCHLIYYIHIYIFGNKWSLPSKYFIVFDVTLPLFIQIGPPWWGSSWRVTTFSSNQDPSSLMMEEGRGLCLLFLLVPSSVVDGQFIWMSGVRVLDSVVSWRYLDVQISISRCNRVSRLQQVAQVAAGCALSAPAAHDAALRCALASGALRKIFWGALAH